MKYRVFKRVRNHKYLHEPEELYEIYEVVYDDHGVLKSVSDSPEFVARSLDGLKSILKDMLESCDEPVLDKLFSN